MIETVDSRYTYIFFFTIITLLPISLILGPAVSLVNILIISISFLMLCFFLKSYRFLQKKEFLLLVVLNFYLIFNSFISLDFYIGFARNFGFLRFILLFLFVNYFFFKFENSNKLFNTWLILILVISIDIFIEFIFGRNLFGYGGIDEPHGTRVVSFFKDEPVAGAFVYGFSFIVLGYLFNKYSEDKRNIVAILFLPLLFFTSVLITGERSNAIKFFIGIVIFFLFADFLKKIGGVIKILDGNNRAIPSVAIKIFSKLKMISNKEKKYLKKWSTEILFNHNKKTIGKIISELK